MRIARLILFAALLAAGTAAAYATPAGSEDANVELTPCRLSGAGGQRLVRAECGEVRVPLDPAAPDGEQISLAVATLPALSAIKKPVALTVIAGGPGQASSEFYAAYQAAFERLREEFDIVLVDQRGTGKSLRLDCPLPEQTLGDVWSVERTARMTQECLDQIDADPTFFTTTIAVQDLEQVRQAFGYEQLSIYGISYGTRVAQHYLRRYPANTHSVILDGVVPVDEVLGPDIAIQAQRSLDLTFERCAASTSCNEAFPKLLEEFVDLQATLRNGTVSVSLNHPVSAQVTDVDLAYTDFVGAIRLLSYSPDSKSLLPLFIHEAAKGNYIPITAEAIRISESFVGELALGMHNAVVCTEDAPFFGEFDEQRLEQTYLGKFIAESLAATCAIWPAGLIDDDFKEPFESSVPVLILSGELDPITPPAYGERVAAYLRNARHLVGPGQGHGVAAVGCVPRLLGEFARTRSFDEIDASCLEERQSGEPFFISFSGPEP